MNPDLGVAGWTCTVEEVSAGVYQLTANGPGGRSIQLKGTNPDRLIDECRAAASDVPATTRGPLLDLYEELRSIADALEGAGIEYALVGGLAVSIYATPRATRDIDLLLASSDMERLIETLRPLGYEDLAAPMHFAQGRLTIRRLTKLAGTQFLMVDVLLPVDPSLVDILKRRRLATAATGHLWVAPVDGLIALKQLRGSPQDLADIAALSEGTP